MGSWRTRVEYKDIQVTSGGKTLYASDFAAGTNGWRFLGPGEWSVADGTLRQSSDNEFVRAIIGDKSWTNYTYSLKARKLGGNEGFLVLFRVNNDDDKSWWNLGGWGNTAYGIEMNDVVTQIPGSIQTGRWYDIRVEVTGPTVKCYLDGKLIHSVQHASLPSLYASATRDSKSGDLILKVVNGASEKIDTAIHLEGAPKLSGAGQSIVLSSDNPSDENSLDAPTKVSPKTLPLSVSGPDFQQVFPGNSLTVLRIGAR